MFIRWHRRFKNGKWHRYYSVVENRRCANGQHVQRQVLYLGEISPAQEHAWQQALDQFNSVSQRDQTPDLFAPTRRLSTAEVRAQSLRQDAMRLHRRWFTDSAMDELLQVGRAVAAKDRLYRCLDRILPHRKELFVHLQNRWRDLFNASFDILLYDLTSTYFEGLCEQIPMARHGYSRDGRPDCRQVVIALVVTPDGLPLAYEVMPGHTSDRTTLEGFLGKIEQLYGKARRTWVMDRGITTEQTLSAMRARGIDYLMGTPRWRLSSMEKKLMDKPCQQPPPKIYASQLAALEGY